MDRLYSSFDYHKWAVTNHYEYLDPLELEERSAFGSIKQLAARSLKNTAQPLFSMSPAPKPLIGGLNAVLIPIF